jgi:hypothetical protein
MAAVTYGLHKIYNIPQPLNFVIWLRKRVTTIKNGASSLKVLFLKIKHRINALFVALCKELKLQFPVHMYPRHKSTESSQQNALRNW